jgi:hypothetical protein
MTALQWIALCFAFVRLAAFQEIAQAYWLAETRSARIGEPVMLTLQANLPAGSQVEWPALPSSSVMLTEGGELVRQPGTGIDIYSQTFTVTIWEWGDHTLPPMTISYQQDDTPAQQISPAPIVIQHTDRRRSDAAPPEAAPRAAVCPALADHDPGICHWNCVYRGHSLLETAQAPAFT